MAAAPLVGTSGSVTLPGVTNAALRAWSATFAQGVVDVTAFSSGGWAERVGTIRSATGAASGQMDISVVPLTNALSGTPAALSLITTGTKGYSGSAVISNFSVQQVVEGVATVSFDFISSGTWTQAL